MSPWMTGSTHMKHIHDPAPPGFPPEPYVPPRPVEVRGNAAALPSCLAASQQRRPSRSLARTDPFGYGAGTYSGSTPATMVRWKSRSCFNAQRSAPEDKYHLVVGQKLPGELFHGHHMTYRTRLASLLASELRRVHVFPLPSGDGQGEDKRA
jgi:hypothetical protein